MVTTHTDKLSSTLVTLKGVRWEVCTFRGGRTEIYREYEDGCGLMQFLGYYDEVSVAIQAQIHPTVSRHLESHQEHWRPFLRGASTWLAAV